MKSLQAHRRRTGAGEKGVPSSPDGPSTGEQQFWMGQWSWTEASTRERAGEQAADNAAMATEPAVYDTVGPGTIPCPFCEEPVFQLVDDQAAFGVFAEGHCPHCGIRIRSWSPKEGALEACRLRPQEATLLVD